ncbi:MAG: small conductance mechanosensitive channel [Myxococcota bacterium]|jgi:small conductance mechanosensitive channel
MNPEYLASLKLFATTTLLDFGLNLVGAVLILLVGWWLSGWASTAIERALNRAGRVDPTLKPLAVSLTRYAVLVITGLAVLARFGVQTTSIVAVLGAAGLAIGLALQGTLSNVAAGVMLLVLRPLKVGDAIVAGGHTGTVLQVGLFTTELNTPDNVFVSLPNSSVWNSSIINYSRNGTRRIDLTIGIGYDDDVDQAIGFAMSEVRADGRVLEEPAPLVAVRGLGESSVDLVVRAYVGTSDFWPTTFALYKAIKLRFDAEGVTIPFPQRSLHMVPSAPPREAS